MKFDERRPLNRLLKGVTIAATGLACYLGAPEHIFKNDALMPVAFTIRGD